MKAILLMCATILMQPQPAFEVVSIRPGPQGNLMQLARSGRIHETIDDAHVDLGAIELSLLVEMAFDLPAERISSPPWLQDVRFDVMAKIPAGATKKEVPAMLRAMLVERFGMKFHHEERPMQVYDLLPGKGPLRMQSASTDDTAKQGCESPAPGTNVCHDVTMEELAKRLSAFRDSSGNPDAIWLDRPVVDKTGLKGGWDFTWHYGAQGRRGSGAGAIRMADAVKDLGLKLEPQKRPFDTVVIDHIERTPTEN